MRRMKLIPMKVIKYKFGQMDCTVNEDGIITPQSENTDLSNFVFRDEEHLIKSWTSKLNRLQRRLIKVYENGLEVDITPTNYLWKDNEND